MGNFLLSSVILLILLSSMILIIRQKKRGAKCMGCPYAKDQDKGCHCK